MSAGRVLKAIARHCVAMRVSVHGMSKERQVGNAEVTVDGEQVSGDIVTTRARLMPRQIASKLDAIANRARRLPAVRGVSFPGGSYLVPIGVQANSGPASVVFELISNIRKEYKEAAEECRPLWEDHIGKLKQEKVYEQLQRYLVDGETFVNKHTIDLQLMPLGGAPADMHDRVFRSLREVNVSETDAARISREICEMVDSSAVAGIGGESQTVTWLAEVQRMTSRAAAEAVQNMISEPIAEFVESLQSLERQLEGRRGVRTASIENARKAFEKLQSFDFMMPADVRQRAASLGVRLQNAQSDSFRGADGVDFASSLASTIRGVREELEAPATQSGFAQVFFRSIDI